MQKGARLSRSTAGWGGEAAGGRGGSGGRRAGRVRGLASPWGVRDPQGEAFDFIPSVRAKIWEPAGRLPPCFTGEDAERGVRMGIWVSRALNRLRGPCRTRGVSGPLAEAPSPVLGGRSRLPKRL